MTVIDLFQQQIEMRERLTQQAQKNLDEEQLKLREARENLRRWREMAK